LKFKMNLLVVMENYPLPMRAGGAIVGYNTILQLARQHKIDFICFRPESGGDELDSIVDNVFLVSQQHHSALQGRLRIFSRLLTFIYPGSRHQGDPRLCAAINNLATTKAYDAVLLFELSAVKHCPSTLRRKMVVNIEDPQSIRISRMADLPVWPISRRLKLKIVAWLTGRYEKMILPKIGTVLLLSKRDIEDFRKQGNYSNLAYVPYGVAQRNATDISPYKNRKKAIVYSGNMFHPPNVDGALFFLNEVFPSVLQTEPSAILWIVGADPDERIRRAAQRYGASVEITGRVADVSSYVESAVVSICPVRLEIGVQTKILESLSLGTPVVTTGAGNRGVGATAGRHLHVEDDAERFAKRVCELFRGENWENLSAEGRRFAAEHFSWEESARQLDGHVLALTRGGQ
jgi:glycosyltransferase involved in cell wall biosynthesis